jgi:hypothetical protein
MPVAEADMPRVTSDDYDALWDATCSTVMRYFDLFTRDKDQGYLLSEFKRGDPLPGGLRRDAQTGYDAAEEFLHIVRRRLTARVTEESAGVFVVRVEVIRERQSYRPPRRGYGASYSLYEPNDIALDDAADQGETVTWARLARDTFLERAILNEIRVSLVRRGTD